MGAKKRLPVGIEFFDELIRENFYYIDKTGLIEELLNNWGKVNLFTRPRRFGKSLLISTLDAYFRGEKEIHDKHYAQPFQSDKRKIFKIGVNFSSKTRNIEKWIVES